MSEAATSANAADVNVADAREDVQMKPARKRRFWLPLILFFLTCISTFFAGACGWTPLDYLVLAGEGHPDGLLPMRMAILNHWQDGLIYMACVVAILLTHEMGHFIATLLHRIPASYPYCIPLPISPFGTMGAVIGMQGSRANRPQMFDIGIAGPLAGLVVAIPVTLYGISQLDLTGPEYGVFGCDPPLAVTLAFEHWRKPPGYEPGDVIWFSQLNPYFMAGWVGLFITGLNMLPMSQLDGGHTVYTLFGRRRALWIARMFLVGVIAYCVYSGLVIKVWPMIVLLLLIGPDHPPTLDDAAPMGWFRYVLGGATLFIPVFCFPLRIFLVATGP
jgi:hypothetical protein